MSEDKELGGKTIESDGGDAKAQVSGLGANEVTGNSKTAENAAERVNPSAPGETGTTPGTGGKQ